MNLTKQANKVLQRVYITIYI